MPHRTLRGLSGAALLATVGACAPGLPPLPLRPEPIPYADTLPIPEPGERDEDRFLRAALIHAPFDLADPFTGSVGESLNLTHFDDLVPSSWWEPRMGYGEIGPAALAAGPTTPSAAPDASHLLIVGVKKEGVTPGFTVKDAKGDRYIVKFDPPEFFHIQSAAGVIVNRLMWGAGFHVPEDFLMVFDSTVLEIDEDLTVEIPGGERPMTRDDLRALLARTASLPDGRFLALASKYVPGIPKGPFFFVGTRDDDPNDYYEHEHRREIRALRVFSAWVHNADMREGNTLDVFMQPGYLRHYVIDFGATLGSGSTRAKHPKDGAERPADIWRILTRLASLGAYAAEWEDEPWDILDPALGYLRSDRFQPEAWKAAWSNPAWVNMTDADAYWAAKIVAAFSDEHIRAAVAEGGLPRPELEDTLSAIMAVRRDLTVRHWYARASTVEAPEVVTQEEVSFQLAFRDFGLEEGLWEPSDTRYAWKLRAGDHTLGEGFADARPALHQAVDVAWPAGAATEGVLLTLEIQTRRPGLRPPPARVYLVRDGGRFRVVGLMHGDEG